MIYVCMFNLKTAILLYGSSVKREFIFKYYALELALTLHKNRLGSLFQFKTNVVYSNFIR